MGNPFCRTAAMSASDADEYQAADLGVRLIVVPRPARLPNTAISKAATTHSPRATFHPPVVSCASPTRGDPLPPASSRYIAPFRKSRRLMAVRGSRTDKRQA